jgi:ribosomal protein L37E
MSNKSLEEIQNKRKYQISSVIRSCARVIYKKSDRPKYCSVCGYSKHYEVCHMKAINSFSPSIMISEINNLDNLVALCPNCHWELDNGLLEI